MVTAYVSWPSAPFTESLVRKAIEKLSLGIQLVSDIHNVPQSQNLLQWSTYDDIDHERTHLRRETTLASSYTIRKALIRKHFLSRSITTYVTKHPDSVLTTTTPKTFEMEISFADELDELLADDLWELNEAFDSGQDNWWILKPGMADRGNGIRLFKDRDGLESILQEFEPDSDDEEEQGDAHDSMADPTQIITSQLRHFVIQEYLSDPLLIDPSEVLLDPGARQSDSRNLNGHKFHLRAYCFASGSISLYLYARVLALFSAVPYQLPSQQKSHSSHLSSDDLAPHLTNSSLQIHRGDAGVRLLDELVGCHILSGYQSGQFEERDLADLLDQMPTTLSETFEAAVSNRVHFQPIPNAFELYGVDFLISHPPKRNGMDSRFQCKLLEINAEPAIELTGPRLGWILEDLFVAMAKVCIEPFFAGEETNKQEWAVGERKNILIKCMEETIHHA